MAEKNFKVLGLDVVGSANITSNIVFTDPNSAIDFSSYLVDVDVATGKLRIGQANLATEQYVTDAIGNISIPDAYITSIGQSSPFLTVGQGALDVSLGNGLEANLANNTLQLKLDGNGGFDYNEGRLRVKAWNGIQVNDNGVAVETNYIANAIAGSGLAYNGGTGTIGLDYMTVGSNLSGQGTYGILSFDGTLGIDEAYVANAIAGTNLEFSAINNKLKLVDSPTIAGTLTVTGDLVVNGSTTTLNTTTLEVEDNLIVLNKNVTGTPLSNAGIEIERGDLTNASLYFDEETDSWKAHNGTSIVTIGSSYITSTSGTFSVSNGQLALNLLQGGGLTQSNGENLSVSIHTDGGLALDQASGGIKAIAGDGITVGSAGISVNPYGTTTKYDGQDVATSYGSSVKNLVGRVSPQYNEYAILARVPSAASSFEAYITIQDPGTYKSRTSKVIATTDAYASVEYTEFAIVEIGQGSIDAVDVLVEYEGIGNTGDYVIKVKANGGEGACVAVADVKYITVV